MVTYVFFLFLIKRVDDLNFNFNISVCLVLFIIVVPTSIDYNIIFNKYYIVNQ